MMRRFRALSRIGAVSALLPVVVVAVLSVYRPAFMAGAERATSDALLRLARARPPDGRVAIVDIDERSLSAIGQWPWRRDVLGTLVSRVRSLGASAVAVDVLLAEAERGDSSNASTDPQLAEMLRGGAGRSRLRADIRPCGRPTAVVPAAAAGPRHCQPRFRRRSRPVLQPLLSRHRRHLQPACAGSGRRRVGLPQCGARLRRHPPARSSAAPARRACLSVTGPRSRRDEPRACVRRRCESPTRIRCGCRSTIGRSPSTARVICSSAIAAPSGRSRMSPRPT